MQTMQVEKLTYRNNDNNIPIKQSSTGKRMKILSDDKQRVIDKLIDKYSDVFGNELGEVRGYQCTIKLKDNTPISVKPYPFQ